MGALMRAHNWAAHPLGPPARWPQSLRTALRILLNTGHPMYVFWGEQGWSFYNDAYRLSLGVERHPSALGRAARDVWDEIWHIIGPQIDQVMRGLGATWHKNALIPTTRNGVREDVYWTYSYGPIDDEQAPTGVGGVLVVCTETTEQVRNERLLATETEQQRRNFEQMPGFVALMSGPEHTFTYVNDAYVRIAGKRDYIGNTVRDLFPELHEQGFFELLDRVYANGTPFVAREMPLMLSNEPTSRFIDFMYQPIKDNAGVVTGIFVGGYDITDHVNARSAIQKINADLEVEVAERTLERGRTWQLNPDLLSVIDMTTGVFVRVNPAWTALLGYAIAEVEGRPFGDFIHPDDLASSASAFEQVRQGNPVLKFENRYRHKNGAYRTLSWVAIPEGGKLYSSCRDVTEEKVQAQELIERTAERDRVWQVSRDMLVITDNTGVWRSMNPACMRTLGWSERELIGRTTEWIEHPDDVQKTREEEKKLAAGNLTLAFENRLKTRDGQYRHLLWTVVPYQERFYGVGRDVTEERAQAEVLAKTEEQLRQAQKMEAIGQLTGGLAHDFNNLLAGISGSLELIQKRLAKGRVEDVERYAAAAQGAAKRAAALTHRLLAFSRRQTLAPAATDVNKLVSGMMDFIRSTVGPAIKVDVITTESIWNVMVDAPQLESALLNLCINSRDALPDGGSISIQIKNTQLTERAARDQDIPVGDYVELAVTDTGVGMSQGVMAHAFDPFFTTKPIGEGTGLGLSMIYGFAKQSGGQVRIRSEIGKGTTVSIHLPRYVGNIMNNTDDGETKRVEGLDGKIVLVVDDEPVIRMVIVDVLQELGYKAVEASDSASGLKILNSNVQIDLLVTDVGLPGGMNGRQMAEAARMTRTDLKVLFITGYAESSIIGKTQLSGGMEVMKKPFEMDELAERIRNMLVPG